MTHFPKRTVRQRKIARKRVFAEFVASCLATAHHGDTAHSSQDVIKAKSCIALPKLDRPVKFKSCDNKQEKSWKRFRYGECQNRPAATVAAEQTQPSWFCCDVGYSELLEIHKHVAKIHKNEIDLLTDARLEQTLVTATNDNDTAVNQTKRGATQGDNERKPKSQRRVYTDSDVSPWLPSLEECRRVTMETEDGEEEILLYYKYVEVDDPQDVCEWQKELCQRLGLTGKIRIATEGMNGTVGGKKSSTQCYIKALTAHPLFQGTDIKSSKGSTEDFPKGLTCGVYGEIVPMGIHPNALSYNQAGGHLSVEEFHDVLETHIMTSSRKPEESNTVFVDCRNFYESRIGQFKGALTPDIRKFSYWPEYIDQNVDSFKDKTVVMYCTGGIRCERGSAYLKTKGVCRDVLQLKGGIHRYMEKYPNGHFQGKLFVFDDRYSISTNDSVISNCFYCTTPWDQYQPCTSLHCHQLVLSCPECRLQGSTACCHSCKDIGKQAEVKGQRAREECECTRRRVRIPQETMSSDKELEGQKTSISEN